MKGKMDAVVKTRPKPGAELRSEPIPSIKPDEALVKIKGTSICGTDLHIYDWDGWAQSHVKPPVIIGHEFAGEVVEVGRSVKNISEGDVVCGETHIACGYCFQCRTGNAHICENLILRGVEAPGCFSDYHAVPENSAWKRDPKIPIEVASAQEPLGNAVYAVSESQVQGKSVAIFGCGSIGLCAVAVSKAYGATQVVGVDVQDYKLKLAKTMGADHAINSKREDPVRRIKELTGGKGCDILIEMSGVPEAIVKGFEAVRAGGRVVLFGLPPRPVELDISNNVVFKSLTIRGIYGRKMFATWYETENLLKGGLVDLSKIITHRMRLEDFDKAFELMRSGRCGKIVMHVS